MIAEDQITVAAIQPSMVDMMWPIVGPMIDMAIEHSNGELDIDAMKQQIKDQDMILITVSEKGMIVATLTLEKRTFESGKKVANITTAGGADLHIWMEKVLHILEELAMEQGCSELYIIGRPGWQRALKKQGFEVIHTTVSKKLGAR